MVDSLDATAAVRSAKNATSGNLTRWDLGLDWRLLPSFRLRATGAQATHAPNIGALFDPPQQTCPPCLSDPCVGVRATTNTPVSNACHAAPGTTTQARKASP